MIQKLSDWDYVYAVAKNKAMAIDPTVMSKAFPKDVEEFRAGMDWPEFKALAPYRSRFQEIGLSYQEMLCAIIAVTAPEVVVETGVRTGVSTHYLYAGMPMELHSIDPMYTTPTKALEGMEKAVPGCPLPGDRWTFWGKRSIDALLELAIKTGGWDLFVHDSDHRLECQTFELEFAWSMLRPGGMLVCDDWDFPRPNGNPHGAFTTFCKRKGLEFNTIGTAAVVAKPAGIDERITSIATPQQLFRAAVSVAVSDQKLHDPGTEPGYMTYLLGGGR